MGLLTALVMITQDVFTPLGPLGLFLLAFAESSFFPVPPDLLLTLMVLEQPDQWFFFAFVATIGSVFGGMFGYAIGRWSGDHIVKRIIKERHVTRLHALFDKYGFASVFLAGFSPIPYKVFTIGAGLARYSFVSFLIASTFSRGARFFLESWLIMQRGEEVLVLMDQHFLALSVGLFAVIFLFFLRKPILQRARSFSAFFSDRAQSF